MNYMKRHLYKAMFWLLPWLCAVPLASCSPDDDIDLDGDNAPATLQLSITAREEGDLNTRAEGYEEGKNSEYMHNLLVLLIKDNKVVKKFLPDLSNNAAAQTGNLKTWVSEEFMLESGIYSAYAFANIDSYFSTAWSSLTGIGIDTDISSLNIDQIVLNNPASKLDLIDYFIPMSAKENVIVTSNTKSISIGLDRLVSKIRMNVSSGGKTGTDITCLTFSGYADKIALIEGTGIADVNYDQSKTLITASTAVPEEGLSIPDFYVNSSPAGHPFTVTINTVEANGITHTATAVTQRDELPRNSIFPLTLQLNNYGLDLDAECWLSPIGSLPVPISVSFKPDTYEIDVPEGCQFVFTISSIIGGTNVTDLKGTWNITSAITGITFDGETSDVTTVKGHVTASAGKTFELGLLVTWKDGSASYERTYTVILNTTDLTNYPLYSKQKRTPELGLDYLRPEMLNMFIK